MTEIMTLESLLQELKNDGKDATSQYHLRNEEIQSKDRTARIPKIKKELKKKDKLLIPTELAIPFNPITGVQDETYNPSNKFRPIMSATKLALMLKDLANRNEDTKKAFMGRAGIDTWDTSDVEKLTKEDIAIFNKYRVPVVYTLPVASINIPAMTGQYSRDYTINVERDEISGALKNPDDEPLVLQANRFFRDLCYEEVQAYQEKIDKGEINDTEQVQKQTKSNIYGKNPVSDDHPSNWLICVDLPLITNYKLNTEVGINYQGMDMDELKSRLGLIKMNKAIKDSINKYKSGEWAKYDRYFDYYEIDMCCPSEGSTPAEIGQSTTYEKPTEELEASDYFAKIDAAMTDYLNDRTDVEKTFLASVRISEYNEQVERQLATALKGTIDLENEWLTKEVIKKHSDFLSIVMGDEANDLLLDVEMDVSDRADGVLDEEKSKQEYDLNKMLNDDGGVDLEELDMAIPAVE